MSHWDKHLQINSLASGRVLTTVCFGPVPYESFKYLILITIQEIGFKLYKYNCYLALLYISLFFALIEDELFSFSDTLQRFTHRMFSNQMKPLILCTLVFECPTVIQRRVLSPVLLHTRRIPIAKIAAFLPKKKKKGATILIGECRLLMCICVCLCIFEREPVVFLSELISSYPPPTPPQRAVNRVSTTR